MIEHNLISKAISLTRKRQRGFSIVEIMIVAIVGTSLAAMTIPALIKLERNFRSAGDARSMNGALGLAKMRAASDFTRARVRINTGTNTFRVQIWCKRVRPGCSAANTWSTEGGTTPLSKGVSFGYGAITSPPPNTQTYIGQASACQTNSQTIANTTGTVFFSACIIFNSRGIPVNAMGIPTGEYAAYITDGSSVYAATVSATGLTRQWRSDKGAANWKQR